MGHVHNGMAYLYSGYDFAEQRQDCMENWAKRIATCIGNIVVPIKQGPGVGA